MFDGEAFGQQMVEIVRGYVANEIEPLRAENKALAARIAELEVQLPAPAPLTVDEVRAVAVEVVQTAVSVLPEPEPLPDIAALAKDAAAEQVAALAATLPLPEKGRKASQERKETPAKSTWMQSRR